MDFGWFYPLKRFGAVLHEHLPNVVAVNALPHRRHTLYHDYFGGATPSPTLAYSSRLIRTVD